MWSCEVIIIIIIVIVCRFDAAIAYLEKALAHNAADHAFSLLTSLADVYVGSLDN